MILRLRTGNYDVKKMRKNVIEVNFMEISWIMELSRQTVFYVCIERNIIEREVLELLATGGIFNLIIAGCFKFAKSIVPSHLFSRIT